LDGQFARTTARKSRNAKKSEISVREGTLHQSLRESDDGKSRAKRTATNEEDSDEDKRDDRPKSRAQQKPHHSGLDFLLGNENRSGKAITKSALTAALGDGVHEARNKLSLKRRGARDSEFDAQQGRLRGKWRWNNLERALDDERYSVWSTIACTFRKRP
jgi:hypothetical protein